MDSAPQDIKLMPINARQIARPRLTTFKRSGTVRNIETPYPVSDSIITPIPTATRITVRDGERLPVEAVHEGPRLELRRARTGMEEVREALRLLTEGPPHLRVQYIF